MYIIVIKTTKECCVTQLFLALISEVDDQGCGGLEGSWKVGAEESSVLKLKLWL